MPRRSTGLTELDHVVSACISPSIGYDPTDAAHNPRASLLAYPRELTQTHKASANNYRTKRQKEGLRVNLVARPTRR